MIMGIAIFGSLTAVITSLVLEPAKEANGKRGARDPWSEATLHETNPIRVNPR
jgi:hypothetical protein